VQQQGGLAAMVAERVGVDEIGMDRGGRVGERARLGVGIALRILLAQRLQLAESALRVAQASISRACWSTSGAGFRAVSAAAAACASPSRPSLNWISAYWSDASSAKTLCG